VGGEKTVSTGDEGGDASVMSETPVKGMGATSIPGTGWPGDAGSFVQLYQAQTGGSIGNGSMSEIFTRRGNRIFHGVT
jgi:hypothetical protein